MSSGTSFSSGSYAAQRVIRIVLTGDSSGLIRAFGAADAAASGTRSKMERMRLAGTAMSSVGQSMLRMSLPILAVGGYAIKTAADFGKSMMLMRTQVGLTAKQTDAMSAGIMNMAPRVGQGPKELADALYPLVSVGLRGKQALDALRAAAMGADVSGASLADTSNAVAGAMKTQLKDVNSASDAMAIMNETAVLGKMHLQDLVGAMATGILPEAKRFGLGFRDVGTALAAMTREGIPAQSAAARMRLALTKMAAPTGATLKAFATMGLSQTKLATDMRGPGGLLAAMEDLRAHLARYTPNSQNILLAQAFGGSRSMATVASMLNAIPSMEQIAPKEAAAGTDKLTMGMKVWGNTITGQFAKAIASIKVSLIGLGNALAPIVERYLPVLVRLVTGAFNWFTKLPGPVKDAAVGFTAFLVIGGPILILLGSMVTAIGVLVPVIGGIGAAFVAVSGMITGFAIDLGIADVAMAAFGVEAGTALTIATGGLILVVAAVIAAIVLLVTHFNDVKNAAVDVFNWVIGHWKLLILAFGPLGLVILAIVHHFSAIKDAAVTVFNWIVGHWKEITAPITAPFLALWKWASKVFNDIVTAAKWMVKEIKKVLGDLSSPFKAIAGLLSGPGHAVSGIAKSVAGFFGLSHGGYVKHLAGGGPVGTDTVPGWLTPGEFVMSTAMTNQIGSTGMSQLMGGNLPGFAEQIMQRNAYAAQYGSGAGGGQNITITPGVVNVRIDAKTIAKAVVEYTLQRAARGPSSLVGGALMTGSSGPAAS